MGADFWFSAVPLNLSNEARELLGRVEDASPEFVALAAYRARLDDSNCLAWLDLAKAPTLSAWLEDEQVRVGAERSAVVARLREAVDELIGWPRDLGVFTDRVGERSWLVAGGLTSGDLPSPVCYELDLVAESGLCDRAVIVDEVEAVLVSMGFGLPDRSEDLGLGGEWVVEDEAVAAAEGWGLFWTGREPCLEVQCIDAPCPGDGVLVDDFEAWRCVLDGVLRGSPVHARAFGALLVHAPSEAAAMVAHWAGRVGDHHRKLEPPARAPGPAVEPPLVERRKPARRLPGWSAGLSH
jgi:hypothetical protein